MVFLGDLHGRGEIVGLVDGLHGRGESGALVSGLHGRGESGALVSGLTLNVCDAAGGMFGKVIITEGIYWWIVLWMESFICM